MKKRLLILLLSITTLSIAQVSDRGLLAYYNFDSDTNNQVAGSTQFDLAPAGVPPVISNNSNGVNGTNCVSFDGTGALVTTDFFNQLQNNPERSLSISLWVNPEAQQNTQLASYFEFFNSMFLRGINPVNGGINTSNTDANFTLFQHSVGLQPNNFTHFVIVFDAFNQRLLYYRNGVLTASIATTTSTIRFLAQTAFFGGGADSTGSFTGTKGFVGSIDEVYVFNRPLMDTEVASLFNLETPQRITVSPSNLLAYYSFDDTLLNEAPGAAQYHLNVAGSTSQPPTSIAGLTGGDINNGLAYSFNGGSALFTDDFGPYYASSASQDVSISMWLSTPSSSGLRTVVEMFSSLFLRGPGDSGISTANGIFNIPNSTNVLGNSQWQHISLVFDSSNQVFTFYLNGIVQRSIPTTTGDIIRYNDKTVIGGGTNADGSINNSKYFTGELDEIYIFNRVLTDQEVTAFSNKAVIDSSGSTCPMGDVIITSQAEINALAGCTDIPGDLIISGANIVAGADSITDLSPLNDLTNIAGNIEISDLTAVTSLPTFESLTAINGNYRIANVPLLTSLPNVPNQATLTGDLEFSTLPQITSLPSGLSSLNSTTSSITLANLNGITSVPSLSNLQTVGGSLSISGLTTITTLPVLDNLTSVVGSVLLVGLSQVTQFNLPSIVTVGVLNAQNNPALTDINVPALQTAGQVIIAGNAGMTQINGFPSLTEITDRLAIALQLNIVSVNAFSNLQTLGYLQLQQTNLTNVDFLSNVSAMTAGFALVLNPDLDNLNGLNNVTIVEGVTTAYEKQIRINRCNNLTSLGSMDLTSNNHFSDILITNDDFSGSQNLTDISALSGISGDLTSLYLSGLGITDLNALSNISRVLADISINSNNNLINIDGLSNLDVQGLVNFFIVNNPLLDNCAITSVCNALNLNTASGSPTISIGNNNTNCDSVGVVTAACQALSEEDFNDFNFNTYPNPFVDQITIDLPTNIVKAEVNLIDIEGKVLLSYLQEESRFTIDDLNKLANGLYFLQVILPDGKESIKKLIK